ncbi:2816_t:CDS:1, partial [Cetraspora pellucida]
TIYFGYAQKEDCKCTYSESQIPKRISEVRSQINWYSYEENTKINLDINKYKANIKIEHLIAYEHSTYCESNLSQNAIA